MNDPPPWLLRPRARLGAGVTRLMSRVWHMLPEGRSLPDDVWRRRHAGVLLLLWLQIGGLVVFGLLTHNGALHSFGDVVVVAAIALLAGRQKMGRRPRAVAASFGLVTESAILVHLSGGYIEMHFHFFVMVAVIALYQDWAPFLMTIAYVALQHGLLGVISPMSVYNHPAAWAHPWRWAVVHAVFVLGAAVAGVVNWRAYETARASTESLAAVGRVISQSLDLSEVTRRIAESVRGLLRAHSAVVYRLDQTSGDLVAVAVSGQPRGFAPGVVLPAGTGTAGFAVSERRPIATSNVLTDPRITTTPEQRARIEHAGYRAALALPLMVQNRVIGALRIGDYAGRTFNEADIRLAEAFGDQAAVALENARLFADAERRRHAAESLAEVGRVLLQSLEPQEVAQRIVDSVKELFQTQSSGLYRLEPATGDLVALAASDGSPRIPRGMGAMGLAIREGGAVATSNLLTDSRIAWTPELRARVERSSHRAVLAVPLVLKNRVIGALAVGDKSGRVFDGDAVRLAEAFADKAALALEKAQLYREQEIRAARLRTLARLNQVISSSLDPAVVLPAIGTAARDLMGAETVVFWMVDEAAQTLELTAFSDGDPIGHAGARTLTFGEGAVGRVAAHRQPVNVPDVSQDDRLFAREWWQEKGLRSMLGVPIMLDDALLAVLAICGRTPFDVGPDEQEILGSFIAQAAVAIRNARLHAQLRAALERYEESQGQLVQAQKMEAVGRLAGGIAHDFNNLLTVICGRTALLFDLLGEDGEPRKHVQTIDKVAERAAALTAQLLAFSRKQILQLKVLDLNALVANMEDLLRRLIGEHIELRFSPASGLAGVKADPGHLEQVIVNLVVNARDAMPVGGRLTLETGNVELDETYVRRHPGANSGSYVMLAVSDTGVGMDAETRSRVFEPFFTTKEPGKGSGLGLSTAYGIIKQSGGNIWVYSEPGQGTTFKVYLPRVSEPIATVAPTESGRAAPRGSETILLVEDEDDVRALTREVLAARGYTVLEASSPRGAEGIAEGHRGSIELLVTDVVMPGMSGSQLAEALAPRRPGMKVLYMSGYTDDAIVHHGVLAPGTPFLQKPFRPESLARKVREVLDA